MVADTRWILETRPKVLDPKRPIREADIASAFMSTRPSIQVVPT